MDISIEVLSRAVSYCPHSGLLSWRDRVPSDFATVSGFVNWKRQCEGRPVGFIDKDGYRLFKLLGARVMAHYAAWCLHYGTPPTGTIDHQDGIRDNNRISNLRLSSRVQNGRNQSISARNKTGRIGVSFRGSRWLARINVQGRDIYLGSHESFGDASAARVQAEQRFGFHQNHGKRLPAPYRVG